jgi:threonine aldolase
MRQAGVIAAAALHGLQHHRVRLSDDHARARRLAERLATVDGVRVVPPDTNIVMIDLPLPVTDAVVARAAAEGVRVSAWNDTRVRCVTHLDVDDAGLAHAADVVARALRDAIDAGMPRRERAGAVPLR